MAQLIVCLVAPILMDSKNFIINASTLRIAIKIDDILKTFIQKFTKTIINTTILNR